MGMHIAHESQNKAFHESGLRARGRAWPMIYHVSHQQPTGGGAVAWCYLHMDTTLLDHEGAIYYDSGKFYPGGIGGNANVCWNSGIGYNPGDAFVAELDPGPPFADIRYVVVAGLYGSGIGGSSTVIWHYKLIGVQGYAVERSVVDFSVIQTVLKSGRREMCIGGDDNAVWQSMGYMGVPPTYSRLYELSSIDLSDIRYVTFSPSDPQAQYQWLRGVGGDQTHIWATTVEYGASEGSNEAFHYEVSVWDLSIVRWGNNWLSGSHWDIGG